MPQSSPAILVVAYGSPDVLRRALAAHGDRTRVVVVDNSSSDAVRRVAIAAAAEYVDAGRNLGYAAGVNAGLRVLGAQVDVLLLNPDAQIEWESVCRLQEVLHSRPMLAAVAPTLRRPDGSVEPTCWPMPDPWLPWRGIIPLPFRRGRSFLNGAVLLLNAEAIKDVGEFDERYFLYAEEADWQARSLDLGWDVSAVEGAVAVHVGAGTSSHEGTREGYFHASAELLIRKRFGAAGWSIFRVGSILAATRRLVLPGLRNEQVRRRQVRAIRLYVLGPVRCLQGGL